MQGTSLRPPMGSLTHTPAPAKASLAFLSDIHGNLEALEAVLAELARRAITDVYVAGDLLLGGADPLGVWRRLTGIGAKCTRGTSDTALATVDPRGLKAADAEAEAKLAAFIQTREALGDLILAHLRRMPTTIRMPMMDGGELMMVHGSPRDATLEMSHDLSDEEMLALIDGDPADIVICGSSHTAFERDVEGVRVINVGSVGASPEGRMAHFAVVTPRVDGTLIERAWVEY